MTRTFYLGGHPEARGRAIEAVRQAEDGMVVTIKPRTRSLEQSAKFHAQCGELANSGLMWAGKRRTAAQWKVLMVSGHAIATKEGAEIIPGVEGEFVNIRESTAYMSRARGSSLIEYTAAFIADNVVKESM